VSAVQSRPCPPLLRAGNPENQPVTRPPCFSSSGSIGAVLASSGTRRVQENHSGIHTPAEYEKPRLDTAPETTLEAVSESISASDRTNRETLTPRLRQTPFRRRLPRFTRAKRSHRPALVLQNRDVDLLRTISEYRLISTPQILRLFSDDSQDGLYRRLQKLFHGGYVDRLGRNPNAPLVYAIGRRGAEVLGEATRKAVGEPYVAHQLMIGNFKIALLEAVKGRRIEISWWALPPHLPVKPDAFFTLQFAWLPEGQNRAHFALEADRSTMPSRRFRSKLERYIDWWRQGAHTEALGIRNFRILTVTRSRARRENLAEVAATLRIEAPMFWFASETELMPGGPKSVLDDVWTVPRFPALRSVVPNG